MENCFKYDEVLSKFKVNMAHSLSVGEGTDSSKT